MLPKRKARSVDDSPSGVTNKTCLRLPDARQQRLSSIVKPYVSCSRLSILIWLSPDSGIAAGWDNFIFRLGATGGWSPVPAGHRNPAGKRTALALNHSSSFAATGARALTPGKAERTISFSLEHRAVAYRRTRRSCPLKADQAKPWARFLHVLHVAAPTDAPKNPARGVPFNRGPPRRAHASPGHESPGKSTAQIWERACELLRLSWRLGSMAILIRECFS